LVPACIKFRERQTEMHECAQSISRILGAATDDIHTHPVAVCWSSGICRVYAPFKDHSHWWLLSLPVWWITPSGENRVHYRPLAFERTKVRPAFYRSSSMS
jgi:hypothetical protein